jgi:hypothetical protein
MGVSLVLPWQYQTHTHEAKGCGLTGEAPSQAAVACHR